LNAPISIAHAGIGNLAKPPSEARLLRAGKNA